MIEVKAINNRLNKKPAMEQYYEKNRDKIELPEWAIKFIGEIFERLRNV